MKRGQVTTPMLLAFELIVVVIFIFYFYQSTHREALVSSPELDEQLTELAIKASFHVTDAHPIPSDRKTASERATSYGR